MTIEPAKLGKSTESLPTPVLMMRTLPTEGDRFEFTVDTRSLKRGDNLYVDVTVTGAPIMVPNQGQAVVDGDTTQIVYEVQYAQTWARNTVTFHFWSRGESGEGDVTAPPLLIMFG
jgi:hypothetical protein